MAKNSFVRFYRLDNAAYKAQTSKDANGIYLNIDKINAIALNYDNLGTQVKEKCVLAEELGHYYMDATYSPYCKDLQVVSKQELKAKKWAYNVLISYEDLRRAILKGKTSILSLAEHFEVTNDFMSRCINFYLDKYGQILTKEEMRQLAFNF